MKEGKHFFSVRIHKQYTPVIYTVWESKRPDTPDGRRRCLEKLFCSINLGSCRKSAAHNFFTALRWKIKVFMWTVNHTLEKGPANLQRPLKPKPVRERERDDKMMRKTKQKTGFIQMCCLNNTNKIVFYLKPFSDNYNLTYNYVI